MNQAARLPDRRLARLRRLLPILALLAGGAALAESETGGATGRDVGGQLRLHQDLRGSNAAGPLARSDQLSPGLAPAARNRLIAEAELRGVWQTPGKRLSANADVLLSRERAAAGATQSRARANELYASADLDDWQISAGKKIVAWDVGYGFRPNDVVQQEERRSLLTLTPEGRPLLQFEHFTADRAAALVWVNPQRRHAADDAQRDAREPAVAARWYTRRGATDWHLFARHGERTGNSLGAAFSWVATDALELHASARILARHDGWAIDPAAILPAAANPWRKTTLGGASQWLLGAAWTGRAQQSLLVEWWHDGTALGDAQWDAWSSRSRALAALPGLPPAVVAGNLAWQASPFAAANLRRDNLTLRAAWQPAPWTFALDLLLTPKDNGRGVTASIQWQGDRVKINAALRVYGGPDQSLFAQLPQRRLGVLAATWTF